MGNVQRGTVRPDIWGSAIPNDITRLILKKQKQNNSLIVAGKICKSQNPLKRDQNQNCVIRLPAFGTELHVFKTKPFSHVVKCGHA